MVIIKDTNLPQLQWHLGRVSEVFPGSDSKMRIATIHTTNWPRKRTVRLLGPLHIQYNEDLGYYNILLAFVYNVILLSKLIVLLMFICLLNLHYLLFNSLLVKVCTSR